MNTTDESLVLNSNNVTIQPNDDFTGNSFNLNT